MKISPRYGHNPSFVRCFWCGTILGKINQGHITTSDNKDAKASEFLTLSDYPVDAYPFCDECKPELSKKFILLEVVPAEEKSIMISEGFAPTGYYVKYDTPMDLAEAVGPIGYDLQDILRHFHDYHTKIMYLKEDEFVLVIGGDENRPQDT